MQDVRVRRLDVFGSAARSDFNVESSDVDLLVEFDDMPHADRADASLGLLTAVEALLQRQVDLVEVAGVRNPYLRRELRNRESSSALPRDPRTWLAGMRAVPKGFKNRLSEYIRLAAEEKPCW